MGSLTDPLDVLDWSFDWSKWLANSETIVAQTVTADVPADVTISNVSQSGGVVTFWTSGAVLGTTFQARCEITTNQGRTTVRSRTFTVRDR